MSMRALSNHVIALANDKDLKLTNLHLQKTLFFTLGFHMRFKNEIDTLAKLTYNVPFQRWKYGPVVEHIYFDYNILGKHPIEESGEYDNRYSHLNETIEKLLRTDVFKLVQVSHQMKAWKKYESDILANNYVPPYEIEEIFEDFAK